MSYTESVSIRAIPPRLTEADLRARYASIVKRRDSYAAQIAALDADLVALRELARGAGLARVLRELESPPAPPTREARTRVKVVRPYRTSHPGPHGVEHFESGAHAVVDLPISLAKALGDRVVVVDPSTPLQARPLQPGEHVD